MVGCLHPVGGGGECPVRIAIAETAVVQDVAIGARMQFRGIHGQNRIDDRRQWSVINDDRFQGILGKIAVTGQHHGHRFAHITNSVKGQGILRRIQLDPG